MIGCVLENFTQACDAIGIKSSIEQKFFSYKGLPCYGSISFAKGLEGFSAPGDYEKIPLFNRHTNRFAYKNLNMPTDIRRKVLDYSGLNTKVKVYESQKLIRQVTSFIRSASEIRFQTKEVHEWLGKSLRYGRSNECSLDGLDVNTIDLPLGGKYFLRLISEWKTMAFLNWFGVYKVMARIDSTPVRKAPALLAITSPDTYEGTIAAGRLLTKVWIYLNSQGIAVHPYYVVSDQLSRWKEKKIPEKLENQASILVEDATRFFELEGNQTLQMLFRIGYPKRAPIKSKRLPLEQVYTDLSKKKESTHHF